MPATTDRRRAAATAEASMDLHPGFEDFFRSDRRRLVGLLTMRLGDVDLATEAVDVAMARAWARWDRLDDPAPWVYRVAHNWATSWLRRRRRISRAPVPDQSVAGPGPDPHPELTAALQQLSDDHRAVISLRIHAGYSVRRTAQALGIAEGTVSSRMSRALEQLRTTLEDAA